MRLNAALAKIFSRIKGLLFAPRREFMAIAEKPSSLSELVFHYLIPLSLLTPLATMIGMNIFDMAWNADHGYRIPEAGIFNVAVANFGFVVTAVLIVGAIFFMLMTAHQKNRNLLQAMNVAIYGAIPPLLSGMLLFLPINILISMAAVAYSLFLFWIGVQEVMHIKEKDASVFVALSTTVFFVAMTIVGVLAEKL